MKALKLAPPLARSSRAPACAPRSRARRARAQSPRWLQVSISRGVYDLLTPIVPSRLRCKRPRGAAPPSRRAARPPKSAPSARSDDDAPPIECVCVCARVHRITIGDARAPVQFCPPRRRTAAGALTCIQAALAHMMCTRTHGSSHEELVSASRGRCARLGLPAAGLRASDVRV